MVRAEDVAVANALSVDYVGLVLYARSPRALDLAQAAALRRQLASHVAAVGLFVNAHPQQVQAAHRQIGLDVVQFHGDESPVQCLLGVAAGPAGPARQALRVEGLARRAPAWWRALRIQNAETLPLAMRDYAACEAFLVDHLDAPRSPSKPALYGGTGRRFDWSLLPAAHARPERLILSGGLDPEHVAQAVLQVDPWAVDVSTGIQANEPRAKDAGKMEAFIGAVRAAESLRCRG
jgi:phosphoribosylanthranilate isomerase